jgi:hypothetical protein
MAGAGVGTQLRPVPHVLVRADLRPSYRDVVELGPTVQCTPQNFVDVPSDRRPESLDLVLPCPAKVRYDVLQSEEGGLFQHAVTRHLIVEVDEDFPIHMPPDVNGLTVAQLKALVRASYQVNLRSCSSRRGWATRTRRRCLPPRPLGWPN